MCGIMAVAGRRRAASACSGAARSWRRSRTASLAGAAAGRLTPAAPRLRPARASGREPDHAFVVQPCDAIGACRNLAPASRLTADDVLEAGMSQTRAASGSSWRRWWPSACWPPGCSVVSKVKQAVHNVEGNKATIDSFTQNLQSTKDTAFEATYTTTGSSPATIVYAVDPVQRRAWPSTRRRRDPTRRTSSSS